MPSMAIHIFPSGSALKSCSASLFLLLSQCQGFHSHSKLCHFSLSGVFFLAQKKYGGTHMNSKKLRASFDSLPGRAHAMPLGFWGTAMSLFSILCFVLAESCDLFMTFIV
jgi:hypothetical protein